MNARLWTLHISVGILEYFELAVDFTCFVVLFPLSCRHLSSMPTAQFAAANTSVTISFRACCFYWLGSRTAVRLNYFRAPVPLHSPAGRAAGPTTGPDIGRVGAANRGENIDPYVPNLVDYRAS